MAIMLPPIAGAVQLLIKNDYETIMNRITKENNQL